MIGENLLRFQTQQLYAAIDLETENLNLVNGRPWQVGIVTFTLKENKGELDRYIWWPDLCVSKKAAQITQFNYQKYKERAEDPIKVLEEVEDIIFSKSYKIVNQNYLGFDAMVLNAWRRALGKKVYNDYLYEDFKVYDNLALSRAMKKGIKPDISSGINFLGWQYRMLSIREKLKCSLGVMAKELGAEVDDSKLHEAVYDCYQAAGVFRKQIWAMEI